MIIPKPLKKWIAVFRGEVSPVLICLSVMLGFWFGLTPGFYGLHAILLVLVLVLNTHIGIFLLAAGIGKTLCFAAAPLLYSTGHFVLGTFGGLVGWLGALPIIGLTDFSRYTVAGALLLGPVIGVIGGLALAVVVGKFRRLWLTLDESSERFRVWRSKGWVKLLDRVLIGKSAKDIRAVLQKKPRIVRIPGVVLAVVIVGGTIASLYWFPNEQARTLAQRSLSSANGAEVDISAVEAALLGGRVTVRGLQITDPENPGQNRVAVERMTADVSLWNALRGRAVLDDIVLEGVEFDQPRESPGEVTAARPPAEDESLDGFDLPDFDLDEVSELATYFKNAKKIREVLAQAAEWLPEPASKETRPKSTPPESYLAYLNARAPQSPVPRIVARRILLDPVTIPAELVGKSRVEVLNLSDAPAAAGMPVTIDIQSSEHPTKLKLVADYGIGEATVEGSFEDLLLTDVQERMSSENPVRLEGGTASGSISGTAGSGQVDLTLVAETQDMQATASEGLFGLDRQVTQGALDVLKNMDLTMRIVGPATRPRLVFDRDAMNVSMRDALVKAGKDELARRADELLADQLGDKLPEGTPKTGDLLKDPGGAIGEGLGGLLGGKRKEEETK